mmetsp:Transcript_15777/g.47357  ORF Transcript_15777/g.47357 Transcript_15777/m.47357 type:complete len:400 (-) Transcript_15777:255-1454(-)
MGACLNRSRYETLPRQQCMLYVEGLSDCVHVFDGVASVEEFEQAVLGFYDRTCTSLPGFRGFLANDLDDLEKFWAHTLPRIIEHAACVEELFPFGVPFLTSDDPAAAYFLPAGLEAAQQSDGWTTSVALSRKQVASLLCHAFLCTIPGRDTHDELPGFAPFSFLRLFSEQYEAFKGAKLRMMLQYFEQLGEPEFDDGGELRIWRRSVTLPPSWGEVPSALSKLEVIWEGGMESCPYSLQVGMSNCYPGGAPGGVLATGKMQDLIVADALDFRDPDAPEQFSREAVERELLKLYAAFSVGASERSVAATGNWCCDAFGGDKQLKLIVQLVAASAAGIRILRLYPHSCEAGSARTDPSELPPLSLPQAVRTAGGLYKRLLGFLDEPGDKDQRLLESLMSAA